MATVTRDHRLGTSKAAHRAHLSEARIRQLVAAGQLSATKTANGHLFDPTEIDRFLAARAKARGK